MWGHTTASVCYCCSPAGCCCDIAGWKSYLTYSSLMTLVGDLLYMNSSVISLSHGSSSALVCDKYWYCSRMALENTCMLSILEAKMQDATLITMNLALGSAVVKSVVLPCDNTSCKDERRWLQGIGAWYVTNFFELIYGRLKSRNLKSCQGKVLSSRVHSNTFWQCPCSFLPLSPTKEVP
jgi:hypothetical protein